jgi:hypothetical protein
VEARKGDSLKMMEITLIDEEPKSRYLRRLRRPTYRVNNVRRRPSILCSSCRYRPLSGRQLSNSFRQERSDPEFIAMVNNDVLKSSKLCSTGIVFDV